MVCLSFHDSRQRYDKEVRSCWSHVIWNTAARCNQFYIWQQQAIFFKNYLCDHVFKCRIEIPWFLELYRANTWSTFDHFAMASHWNFAERILEVDTVGWRWQTWSMAPIPPIQSHRRIVKRKSRPRASSTRRWFISTRTYGRSFHCLYVL